MFSGIFPLLFSGSVEDGGGGGKPLSFGKGFGIFFWDCRGEEEEERLGEEGDILSVFREEFRDGFRIDFPSFFIEEDGWERRRGEEGGNGGGEEEEKLKSAFRKKMFCDHIVFFENHVWGIF